MIVDIRVYYRKNLYPESYDINSQMHDKVLIIVLL